MPKMPALFASSEDLEQAEASLDVRGLVEQGVRSATRERYEFRNGQAEKTSTDYTDSTDGVSSASIKA